MKILKSKIIKIIMLLVMFVAVGLSSTIKISAYNEKERLDTIINQRVQNGTLPAFHLKYVNYPFYYSIYNKWGIDGGMSNMTEKELISMLKQYGSDSGMWVDIIDNLDVPVEALEPNMALGSYFDGKNVYLLWSSEFIPFEDFSLLSLTLEHEGKTKVIKNEPQVSECPALNGDLQFELTYYSHYPELNLQLNVTPILTYVYYEGYKEVCKTGATFLDGAKDFKVLGWTAGLVYEEDETYTHSVTTDVEFNFTEPFKYGGKPVGQFQSHKYIEITDCIAQSSYDVVFGGYKHYVYFNTPIDMDQIYRVDVSYKLLADDAIWTKKLFDDPKTRKVIKSLSAGKVKGGLFNLASYEGLSEGNFASNEKDNHSYKYRLMLNYNEENWDVSEWFHIMEADYKRVDEFYIFRMNFVYQGEEFDMPVNMDTVSGVTKKIYDRDQVLDTSSTIWKFKETAYDAGDKVVDTIKGATEKGKSIGKALLITGGCVLGGVGLYFGIKFALKVKELFKNNKEEN